MTGRIPAAVRLGFAATLRPLALAFAGAAAMVAVTVVPSFADDLVTAIDVLLEPDATMLMHAKDANERLRENYPQGYSLDETHQPHITILQRYVTTEDLDKIYAALKKILAEERPSSWQLKAYKYYYIPWQGLGLAGIVIEPTDDLLTFQQKVIEAVAPFVIGTGTAAAFVHHAGRPRHQSANDRLRRGVRAKRGGQEVQPTRDDRPRPRRLPKEMLNEEFEDFTFSVSGLSVYHLGNFGTAREKLKGWQLKP